jgi:malonate-semialdehyde dehydrogenase (acetylating)/methylmalonate-semialdehyde dehydrogenase
MWTIPIALVLGNCVILKPSEKVPTTMNRVAQLWMTLMEGSGVPSGVFQIINGTAPAVQALISHASVKAITFVGSSPVAEIVASTCRRMHKRVTALGGAKNHLVALTDCDVDQTSTDIVVSYAGCAGQRCMAASVLLIIGNGTKQSKLLEAVIEKSIKIQPGTKPGCMGPVIDKRSLEKIQSYISEAETKDGADILLDGRLAWGKDQLRDEGGNWIGPTIILHKNSSDRAMREEIFGPVLSVYHASSWEEAIQIENSSEFGNAACVYTSNGGNAEWFINRFRAAMLGVNIGIPVPREPFSFGGLSGTKVRKNPKKLRRIY